MDYGSTLMNSLDNSPTLHREPEFISFPMAMEKVAAGRKITKKEWKSREIYGVVKDGTLVLHKDGKFHSWIIRDGDLLGKDWYVLPTVN
jgi:hypothetical protein|tara:strand:- start:859 stop:1125 length:267 start_codon:yes stop_codon:yes gene_type:complete